MDLHQVQVGHRSAYQGSASRSPWFQSEDQLAHQVRDVLFVGDFVFGGVRIPAAVMKVGFCRHRSAGRWGW
ncbi:hypothetical protein AQJ84_40190 [Streptomyces resistomycificus]|uniref:Uncharacterized protein n=1 Tax=Streptomyces resistomycificus TaxID=67356 RepID=A0A0L8LW36_9ACTN|nr:hypothetical protein ADK37_05885 [Streptomyces resistomycificus]KUN90419.1 hypothetical protein AQJ84_40190 [Streptomyces resistomycificus]